MLPRTCRIVFGISALAPASTLLAQDDSVEYVKQPVMSLPAELTAPRGAERMGDGILRVRDTARVSAALVQMDGKPVALDAATQEVLVERTRFFLPAEWNWVGLPGDVDSMGRPIISAPVGWPAWTQEDVDGLRDAIVRHLAMRRANADPHADLAELESAIGNFIGQALVRGIVIDDLLKLDDATVVTPVVRASILERLHGYEVARRTEMHVLGVAYEPSAYPADLVAFVESDGAKLADVLAIEDDTDADGAAVERSTPSGCYVRVNGAGLGLNLLSNDNVIWEANGTDDAFADVPIGFAFNFYECEDWDLNTAVRVSSNGFVTFFQQGGAALDGMSWVNVPIGNSSGPNGFAAGWWDDLGVLNQSSIPDRVSWKIEGVPGVRTLTVQYYSVSRIAGTNTDYHTFQIILREWHQTSPRCSVVLAYPAANVNLWQADTNDDATVGMEGFAGTNGECVESCALFTTVPPRNYTFHPLMNDQCVDALPLQCEAVMTGDLRFTVSDVASCNTNRSDRWYKFDAPCSGTLTVNTCGTHDINGTDTGIDTVLSAYAGCPSAGGQLLACDDDGASCDQGLVRDSRISFNVQGGAYIVIRVSTLTLLTDDGTRGAYKLTADFTPSSLAANDDCANAQSIGAGYTAGGNLLCATPGFETTLGTRNVWFRFHAPLVGTLRVTGCGTNDGPGIDRGPDLALDLFGGCPASPANLLAYNDDPISDVCGGADTSIRLDPDVRTRALAGQDIYISVSHFPFGVATGQFVIHTSFLGADLNGDCAVDLTDLATLLAHFGMPAGASPAQGDVDGDGDVDLTDLANLLKNFGSTCG